MNRFSSAFSIFAVLTAAPAIASADPASWFYVGGGAARLTLDDRSTSTIGSNQLDIGTGIGPQHSIVLGGGARMVAYWSKGLEFGAYARAAMPSYALGRFGIAVDAGAFSRPFNQGSPGFMGTLNLGAPFGFTLSATYASTVHDDRTFMITAGIDLLRLTVYRVAGESLWPNPNPSYRPAGESAPTGPALPQQQVPPPPPNSTDVF